MMFLFRTRKLRRPAIAGLAFTLGLLLIGSVSAVGDNISTVPIGGNLTNDFNAESSWVGNAVPGTLDSAFITNTYTAGGPRTLTNGALSTTLTSLVLSNGGTGSQLIRLLLTNPYFAVTDTATIGKNGVLSLENTGDPALIVTGQFSRLVLESIGATPGATPKVNVTGGNLLSVSDTATLSAGILTIGSVLDGSVMATGRFQNIFLTGSGQLTVTNGNFLNVLGVTTLNNNSRLNLGGGSSTGVATGIFNHLTMADNASLSFGAVGLDGRGPDALIVTGSFANAANNVISSFGGNGLSLFFSNIPAVANSGSITGIWTHAGALNSAFNIQATGSATDSRTNTFRNQGTIVFGLVATINGSILADPKTTWTNQLTVNLVNEGLLTFTNFWNGTGNPIDATNLVFLSGSVAATNTATGTLALYVHTRSGYKITTDFRVDGGFVNAGTLTSLGEGSSGLSTPGTNFFTVTSGAFSNAGFVISPTNNFAGKFTFAIRADRLINTGTILASGATLVFQNSSSGNGILENSGHLLYDGGGLFVSVLTNTSTGVIQNTQPAGSNFVWRAGNTNHNFGVIDTGSGVLTNLGVIVLYDGSQLSGVFSNAGNFTLNGGTTTLTGTLLNRGSLNFASSSTLNATTTTNLALGVINAFADANFTTVANAGILNIGNVLDGSIVVTASFQKLTLHDNGQVRLTNGNLLTVLDTGTLAGNSVLRLGGGAAATTGIATGIFNNLTLTDNASITFAALASNNRGPDALVVTGAFVNGADTLIHSVGGNGMRLQFLNSAVVTNQGMITSSFVNTAGAGLNIRTTTGTETNTFLNTGTIVFGHLGGNTAGGASRTNQWDVNLVNAGFLAFTNAGSGASAGLFTNTWLLNGSRAATNTATGTIALSSFQQGNGSRALLDVQVTGGGFVNLGSLSVTLTNSSNPAWTNRFTVGSGAFSNAPGAQVVLNPGTKGWLAIRADHLVNAGTNLINAGTLLYQTASGAPGILENSGDLILNGGNLVAAGGITNSGTLKGNGVVMGNVHVTDTGRVEPGLSIGTLVFSNNLTLAGTYFAEVNGAGSGTADVLFVAGTLTLAGATLNVSVENPADTTYIIAQYGTLFGTFSTTDLPTGYTLDYNYNDLNQIAVIGIIPEPSTVALTGAALLALIFLRRRRC